MIYSNKNKTAQAGFTLLEVILSLALLSTIMMLCINVLATEFALRQRITERYPFDKIMERITYDISGAFILPKIPQDSQINFIHSSASNNSSLFFSVMNHESLIFNSKESNLARVGYLVEANGTRNELIRIVDSKMEDFKVIPAPGVGVRSVLVEDLKEFKLQFWNKKEFRDEWNSTSNESGKLPKLVKIMLTFYIPIQKSTKKQEMHLETIVYIRNALSKPKTGEIDADSTTEEFQWQ